VVRQAGALVAKQFGPWAAASIHPNFLGGNDFFNSKNQIFSDIQFPSGLDANAHIGGRFANHAARHWDTALADYHKHNHRFTEPGRIPGRIFLRSLCDHVGHPPIFGDRLHRMQRYWQRSRNLKSVQI